MSRGPALSSKPPAPAPSKLDKIEGWTEEPAKAAAEALVEPKAKPAKKPAKPKAPPPKVEEPPWAQFMSGGTKRLANFNLPTELDAKLTWAAHRTFGTRTDVLVKALTEYIDRLVKEGGA